ncbi:E3 ubiquitin-protein ligase Rnf220-like isoform X2 [Watersipora subatra]|uniref:E3 ubiquitin-protein ligase Rnf220-like isoform X2 n=1 Tax=Watersipora subatra TaxID=2589382 RepID=UPI00355BEA11
MQSHLADNSQFLPFFAQTMPKFLWNGADPHLLPLPPFPPSTPFQLPYHMPPQIFNPTPPFFSMLAAQERMGSNPNRVEPGTFQSSLLAEMCEERKCSVPCIPVTPPLTPMICLTPTVVEKASNPAPVAKSSGGSPAASGTNTPPISARMSGRNRRPPAFIEGESTCPICGSLLRASELVDHYQKELNAITGEKSQTLMTTGTRKKEMRMSSRISEKKAHHLDESRKNTLSRVRQNRKSRVLKTAGKTGKRSATPSSTTTVPSESTMEDAAGTSQQSETLQIRDNSQLSTACPVCNKMLYCDAEEMAEHVEKCLAKQSPNDSNQNGSGSDEEYESYTWCGQTRVRATSFLDSNELAASGFDSIGKEEEETAVVVDDDVNEQEFGEAQYSEAHIIPCASEEPAEAIAQYALRNAVISLSTESTHTKPIEGQQSKWTGGTSTDDGDLPLRCLICMDKYSKPLVSVQCWHVHCEECWLRTLGAKKLCPQCNMITSPSDLRRIYL